MRERMTHRHHLCLVTALVLGLGAIPVMLIAQDDYMSVTNEHVPRPIEWATVRSADTAPLRLLHGVVQAAEHAPLSFEMGGQIRSLRARIGERFSEGAVLATLDDTTLQLNLDERRASLAEAESNAANTARDARRQRELHEKGVVSIATLQDAEAQATSARSRLAVAESLIRSAEDQLANVHLIAPYDGVVSRRPVEIAQQVQPGEIVFEIQGEHGGFEIDLDVPDTLINVLDRTASHRIRIGPDKDWHGQARITEVGTRANRAGAFAVTLTIDPSHAPVHAGMVAEIELVLASTRELIPNSVEVPLAAVLASQDNSYHVFVYDAVNHIVNRRSVDIHGFEGQQAVINSGLQAGEIVATRGVTFLNAGMAVSLKGVGIARYDN